MANATTTLSTVAEELRELDLIFRSGSDLDFVEKGYGRKLIQGLSTQNNILECEALKSLGDLYLQKAKMNDNKVENFYKACSLYTELLQYYKINEEKQVLQRRISYAEKCTKLVHNQLAPRNSGNTTLAVSMTLHGITEKTRIKRHGMMPLVESYTESFVNAIVERNQRLQTESLKSIGDLYLEKGRVGKDEAVFTKSAGLYRAALDRCEDSDGRETLKHRIKYAEKVREVETRKARKRLKTGPSLKKVGSDNCLTSPPMSYEQHIQKGCRALQAGDLDTAEHNFAAALKVVHVK
ncbi:PREDICTED: uncharacterized protein LOC109463416, partial [Branchiostoma belcheri]|uniref:Uncharacterized protein LOC109463416 n=1 Tax=Branchiostoma belcheri TaxID=7741 RepID=A0A6P4XZF8_BRABE